MSLRTIDIADANQTLAEYTQQLVGGPIVVTAGGQPIAAVVPMDEFDLEVMSLSMNPKFVEIIEQSRARGKREGSIPIDEVERRFKHRSRADEG